jgi:hypothetical protein
LGSIGWLFIYSGGNLPAIDLTIYSFVVTGNVYSPAKTYEIWAMHPVITVLGVVV